MEKPVPTNLELHPIIKKRWSPRAFSQEMISNNILERIFEAGRWAPSSSNDQPWRFVVGVKGDRTWQMIWDTLVDFNQKWAKHAPVLALTIGKTISDKQNKPSNIYQYDVGQSISYITFQAMAEGVFVHQMGGLDVQKAAELFKVPREYKVLTAFALGYMGEIDILEENFQKMEKTIRKRHALADLVFNGEFGKPAAFIPGNEE
jgi:nitroreductase